MVVDYSKFEKIVAAEELHEAAQQQQQQKQKPPQAGPPRVTRLAQPSRVTIPAKQDQQSAGEPELLIESMAPQPVAAAAAAPSPANAPANAPAPSPANAPAAPPATSPAAAPAPAPTPSPTHAAAGLNYDKWSSLALEMEDDEAREEQANQKDYFEDDWRRKSNDEQRALEQQQQQQRQHAAVSQAQASARSSKYTEGGAMETTHLWAQDRREVRIYVPVCGGTRARDVTVALLESGGFSVRTAAQGCVLHEQLWHDVWGAVFTHPKPLGITDAMEEDNEMQWEVADLPNNLQNGDLKRCVAITLVKQLPTELLRSLWWKAAFASAGAGAEALAGAEATGTDAAAAYANARESASAEVDQSTAAGQSFQAAWTEAQASFKAKVQQKRDKEEQEGDSEGEEGEG